MCEECWKRTDKSGEKSSVSVCECVWGIERQKKWVMNKKLNFSTVHACKSLTIAHWQYDCAYCVFSWADPVVTRKLYSPQCQTAPTPLALHIHPLVPLAHSALSALAGSLSGSTNGRARTNTQTQPNTHTDRGNVNANLIFCPCQDKNDLTDKDDRVPYTVGGEKSPYKQSCWVCFLFNLPD